MIREEWLLKLSHIMNEELFNNEMPKYRVTCGFPSSKKAVGQHWPSGCSDDDTHELIVCMTIDHPISVAGVLAHEMIHAICPLGTGHRGPFREHALRIGLTGKMTATEEGPKFIEWLTPHLEKLGSYPHAKLNRNDLSKKKQTTRLIKCECLTCGYNVRVTRKWIDEQGMPCCSNPTHGPMSSDYKSETQPKPILGTWIEITPEQPTGEKSILVCRKGEKESVEWIKKWIYSAYAENFTHWMPAPNVIGVKNG